MQTKYRLQYDSQQCRYRVAKVLVGVSGSYTSLRSKRMEKAEAVALKDRLERGEVKLAPGGQVVEV